MTFRFVAIFFVVIFFLAACSSKETVFFKKIDNQSSKDITFYFYGNYNPLTYGDSVFVAAGQVKEIYSYSEESSSVTNQQACRVYKDSVLAVVAGGNKLNKRLQDENSWIQTSEDVNQICTFLITDTDIF